MSQTVDAIRDRIGASLRQLLAGEREPRELSPEPGLFVDELIAKFRHYAGALEPSRRAALEALVIDGSPETPVAELRRLVDAPLDARHGGATEEAAR